jgi:hypothetical protein
VKELITYLVITLVILTAAVLFAFKIEGLL